MFVRVRCIGSDFGLGRSLSFEVGAILSIKNGHLDYIDNLICKITKSPLKQYLEDISLEVKSFGEGLDDVDQVASVISICFSLLRVDHHSLCAINNQIN